MRPYSLNSMGRTRTPTRTLGMRLSCNFVNVYTIVYNVQYTYSTRVHARIPNRHHREEKRASDKSPPTSQRAERAAPAAAGRLPRRGARRLLREDPCAEVGEEVRVGVGVRVRVDRSHMEFKQIATCQSEAVERAPCSTAASRGEGYRFVWRGAMRVLNWKQAVASSVLLIPNTCPTGRGPREKAFHIELDRGYLCDDCDWSWQLPARCALFWPIAFMVWAKT